MFCINAKHAYAFGLLPFEARGVAWLSLSNERMKVPGRTPFIAQSVAGILVCTPQHARWHCFDGKFCRISGYNLPYSRHQRKYRMAYIINGKRKDASSICSPMTDIMQFATIEDSTNSSQSGGQLIPKATLSSLICTTRSQRLMKIHHPLINT
jgi:hypothetical protein